MATSYEDIYNVFLRSVNDVEILYPLEGETESEYDSRIEELLFQLFDSAIVKFPYSQTSLSRDNTTQAFNNDLRDIEVEIIGLLMLREYYRKQLNFLVSLKHSFSDKDWKSHDKSNQMNQYRQLLKEIESEIKELILNNTYRDDSGKAEWWTNG